MESIVLVLILVLGIGGVLVIAFLATCVIYMCKSPLNDRAVE